MRNLTPFTTRMACRPSNWAGMNQHNDIAGKTAIDMLISRIHHGERGAPAFPTGTLIGASWVEGKTTPKHPTPKAKS